jgi:hypothetical protein
MIELPQTKNGKRAPLGDIEWILEKYQSLSQQEFVALSKKKCGFVQEIQG